MLSWGKAPAKPVEAVDVEETTTQGPYGLDVCYDGGDQSIADIIFVHGLTGNRESTWTAKAQSVFWPKDILPRDGVMKDTRIMTFGYDADIAHFWNMASQNRLGEHAGNLVNAVTQIRERTDTEGRPIVLVAHSLGGLVTEDALLFSKNSAEEHLQDFTRCAVGICFLGTPHCGSDLARWGHALGNLFNIVKSANVDLLNTLKPDSEVLARVQQGFHTMLRTPINPINSPLKITCFYEELGVRGAGEIVPKHSAILPQYNHIGIHANHMDMTKFTSDRDAGYLSVSTELRRWVKALRTQRAEANRPNQAFDQYGRPSYGPGQSHMGYGDQLNPYGEHGRGYPSYPPEQTARPRSPYDNSRQYQQDPRFFSPHSENYPPRFAPGVMENRREYRDADAGVNYRYQSGRPVSRGRYEKPPPPPVPRFLEDVPPPDMDWERGAEPRNTPQTHIQNHGGVQINGGNVSGGIHYG